MELTINQSRAKSEENKAIVTLAGSATIGEVVELKEVLLAALGDCEKLLLDVGELTGADPALFQLIHATRCAAGKEGKKFVLAGEFSPAFHDAAVSAGFFYEDGDKNESA